MISNRSLASHLLIEYQKTPYLFIKRLAIVFVTPGGDYQKLREYFAETFPKEDVYDQFVRYAVFVGGFLLGMGQYQSSELASRFLDNYFFI